MRQLLFAAVADVSRPRLLRSSSLADAHFTRTMIERMIREATSRSADDGCVISRLAPAGPWSSSTRFP